MRTCKRGLHQYDENLKRCPGCSSESAAKRHAANPDRARKAATEWQRANPERARASCAKWRKVNPERVRANCAKWRKANPEKVRASRAKYYASNREKKLASNLKWQKANPERARASCAKWRKANPEKCRAFEAKRRALERGASYEPFSNDAWLSVVEFYSGLCAYCDKPWEHKDHVHPLALGGAHALSNLVPACAECNNRKHAKIWEPKARHPWMMSS